MKVKRKIFDEIDRIIFQCCVLLVCSVLLVQAQEDNQNHHQDLVLKENYDNFFHAVDSFLWDSEDSEGRMYRRGET